MEQKSDEVIKNDNVIYSLKNEDTNTYNTEKKVPNAGFKAKIIAFWNSIDLFCKFVTISFVIAALLLIISAFSQKVLPIFISIFQIAGSTIAVLMHKNAIKIDKNWIKYPVLVGSFLLIIFNFSSYSWEKSAGNNNESFEPVSIKYDSSDKTVTPCKASDCIGKNVLNIKQDFKSVGFKNISEEIIDDLDISESDKNGMVEAISVNGVSDFEGNQEFSKLSKIVITYHSLKSVSAPISSKDAVSMDSETLKQLFLNAGFINVITSEEFDLNPHEMDSEYENIIEINNVKEFDEADKFEIDSSVKIVTHRAYEVYKLNVSIDFIPNLIFNTYDVKLDINGETNTLTHGKDANFEYELKPGKYTVTFYSADSNSINGETEINLAGETDVSYKIYCHYDFIGIETLSIINKEAVGENEVIVPISASDCKYKNFEKIEDEFKSAGFTNISYKILYDIVYGFTSEGEVKQVTVDGHDDFIKGNIFSKDAEIIITYHMNADDDPNKITETQATTAAKPQTAAEAEAKNLSYSTNDIETAKNGDTGVFSYKNRGGTYSIYYIIDFDDGYVYYFTDGNGEETCDRLKIDSGDLNNVLIVTYHDGDDSWSNGLHFKWRNQPDHLILEDDDHFEYDFYSTNLNDALRIRDKKRIVDY